MFERFRTRLPYFEYCHPMFILFFGDQPLRNHITKSSSQAITRRALLSRRKRARKSLHCLLRIDGVHSREHKVSSLSGLKSEFHSLRSLELTDSNYIWRLAQGRT